MASSFSLRSVCGAVDFLSFLFFARDSFVSNSSWASTKPAVALIQAVDGGWSPCKNKAFLLRSFSNFEESAWKAPFLLMLQSSDCSAGAGRN